MNNQTYLQKSRYPLIRLLNYMRGYRKQYSLAIIYSVLNKLFDVFPEILIGGAVDVVVNQQNSWLAKITGVESMLFQLFALGLITFIAWGLESIFQYLYSLKWRNLAQFVEHKLRMDSYKHIQNAKLDDIERTPTGQLIATINDDINQLERFLEDGINQIIQIVASTILIGIVFLICSPLITLFAIMPIPFILFGAFYFQHRLEPKFLKVREKAANISSALANNLQGLTTIKSYTSEKFEAKRINNLSQDYQQANQETIKISSMVTPVIRIMILTGFLFTLLIGGYQTINHSMNIGVFSLLIFLSQRLLWPFSYLADVTINYQRAMASTTRVLNLLTWPLEEQVKQLPDNKLKFESYKLEFKDINFKYPQTDQNIFDGFNLNIENNQSIAIVGESGSGKSTLIKLICRFYPPNQGKITFSGNNIENFNLQWWRQQISLVSQDVYLFSGTISENIAYPNTSTNMDKIIHAAKLSGADNFISDFPKGYLTQVGQRGLSLSGGQRQRIAIARALLKNAPILILDEATSAVDNETELAIQEALATVTHNKTTIIIAHRLSTIRHVDKIYVLDQGEIIESGNHETLLKKQGTYARLWRIQTGQELTAHEVSQGI